ARGIARGSGVNRPAHFSAELETVTATDHGEMIGESLIHHRRLLTIMGRTPESGDSGYVETAKHPRFDSFETDLAVESLARSRALAQAAGQIIGGSKLVDARRAEIVKPRRGAVVVEEVVAAPQAIGTLHWIDRRRTQVVRINQDTAIEP